MLGLSPLYVILSETKNLLKFLTDPSLSFRMTFFFTQHLEPSKKLRRHEVAPSNYNYMRRRHI